jgi:hypothetical protein
LRDVRVVGVTRADDHPTPGAPDAKELRLRRSRRARFFGIAFFALSVLGYVALHARRAVPSDEVEAVARWAATEAATYPHGSCARPVLRRTFDAEEDVPPLGSLFTRTGPGHACFAAIDDALHDTLTTTFHRVHRAAPLDRPALDERSLAPLCEEVARLVRRGVARDAQCSPFPPGSSGPDAQRMSRFPTAIALVARERARAGAPIAAAELLLDALRATDDLARGGTGSDVVTGSTLASSMLRAHLDEILHARVPADAVRASPALEADVRRLAEETLVLVEDSLLQRGGARVPSAMIVDFLAQRSSASAARGDDVRALHYLASREVHARIARDCPADDLVCAGPLRRFARSASPAPPHAMTIALLGRKSRRVDRQARFERDHAEALANDSARFARERFARLATHFSLVDRVAGCTSAPTHEALEADRPLQGSRYVVLGGTREPYAMARVSGCPERAEAQP